MLAQRILAVDFGERRVGLALAEARGGLVLPLETVERHSDRQAIGRIVEVARREGVGHLVVGEPRNVDGSVGAAAERARAFADKLAAAAGLPCTMVTETLTTVAAEERLREAGVPPARRRAAVDQVAAQILLEEYLALEGAR